MPIHHPTVTLLKSMQLAGANLLASHAPGHDNLLYWCVDIDKGMRAGFRFWWPGHNLGRWWDALLRLQTAADFAIPRTLEATMRRHVRRFFANPDHLCLEPVTKANRGAYAIDMHSQREGMLALHALVRWRGDRWALTKGKAMVASLDRLLVDPSRWDAARFHLSKQAKVSLAWANDPTASHGRLIEAILWFYEATGHAPALDLARRLVEYHATHSVHPDGRFNPASRSHHTHSYFGTLRGICLYGQMTGQHDYVSLAARALRVFVPSIVKPSGFTCHDLFLDRRGETTSPGDAAQLGLWLARDGYPEFWDDVERLVRNRLLASQITTPPMLVPAGDPKQDEYRDLARRVVGAYGGMHAHPHGGIRPTTDITAACLHTLVDVYNHVIEDRPQGVRVNMHFDHRSPLADITTQRDRRMTLTVRLRRKGRALWIRLPQWAPRAGMTLRNGKGRLDLVTVGQYAIIDAEHTASPVTLSYDLPEKRTVEPTDGVEYDIRWRGDTVVEVEPPPDDLPFYPQGAASRLRCFECATLRKAVRHIGDATYPTSDVTFANVTDVRRSDRFVDVRAFHGGRHGLLYVRTNYQAPRGGKGALCYGADGPVKVWIHGKPAGAQRGLTNPAIAEQFSATTRWRKGGNEIVFALDTRRGKTWGLFATATMNKVT